MITTELGDFVMHLTCLGGSGGPAAVQHSSGSDQLPAYNIRPLLVG